MNKKRVMKMCLVLLVGITPACWSAMLELVPSQTTVYPDEDVSIDVIFSNPDGAKVGAYDFFVEYSSTEDAVMTLESVSFADKLGGFTFAFQEYSETQPGKIRVAEASFLSDLSALQDGTSDVVLFTLFFVGKNPGHSLVSLAGNIAPTAGFLSDENGALLSVDTGSVEMTVVPLPAGLWLFFSGMIGLFGVKTTKRFEQGILCGLAFFKCKFPSFASGLVLASLALPASAEICDADGDSFVDRDDIKLIFDARNTFADASDERDADADGYITVKDARLCVRECTLENCTIVTDTESPVEFEEKVFGFRKVQPYNPITGTGGWSLTFLLFLPDNVTVYRDIPKVPTIAGISRDELVDINNSRVGNVSINAGDMAVNWPALSFNPSLANWQLSKTGNDWERSNGDVYQPIPPLPATQLNGVYANTELRTVGIWPNQFSFAFTTVYTFSDDGSFKRDTFNGVFSDLGGGTATTSKEGSYVLEGYTLKLTLLDGEIEYRSAVVWPGEDIESQIVIGERVLERKD